MTPIKFKLEHSCSSTSAQIYDVAVKLLRTLPNKPTTHIKRLQCFIIYVWGPRHKTKRSKIRISALKYKQ